MKAVNRMTNFPFKNQHGSTMIEVLVSLLVFAIGIQGVLSLQYTSLKENLDASQRSRGVWVAEEIINRVRANEAGRLNGSYGFGYDNGDEMTVIRNNNIDCDNPPFSCITGTCTADQLAAFDLSEMFCGDFQDNSFINLQFSLGCTDSDDTDAITCTEDSDYTLNMSWQSKSVTDNDDDIDDPDDTFKTQTFVQVFRP